MSQKNEIVHAVNQIQLSTDQVELLKRTICKGADNDEFQLFVGQCNRTGLDPFSRQIHAVKRWSSKEQRHVMTIQTGIDGFRLIADRTKNYAGQQGPFWCGKDGEWIDVWLEDVYPTASKVGIVKHGCTEVFWGIAKFSSYVQVDKDGQPTKFWKQMPEVMIAKCAEALALRKAFPQDLSGMYVDEELDHDVQKDGEHTKKVVDIGESGQRVESRAPVKDTPKMTVLPKAVEPTDSSAELSAEYTSFMEWLKGCGISEEFVMQRLYERDVVTSDVKTLKEVPDSRIKTLNSLPYRKQILKVFTDTQTTPPAKTIDVEPKAPAAPPAAPQASVKEGYQPDPEESFFIRQLAPGNPFKPEDIDLSTFTMHFPKQHVGKTLHNLERDYLKGFYVRWAPKPYKDKIQDADYRLDAALVLWGLENNHGQ